MNILEAEWIGSRLSGLPDDALFPMLNVGSSSLNFRTVVQPYIDAKIFAPLRNRGGTIYHLDMKKEPGVDIVGDLFDPKFLEKIRGMEIRSVLMSNLLEHVTNRQDVCDAVMSIVPKGGYLIVTGPKAYPYHSDPIDTMFRPTIPEVHAHFPNTEIVDSAIVDSGNWRQWHVSERGRPLGRALVRLMMPFYRPAAWWELARQSPYIFKHITAFAVILRKQ